METTEAAVGSWEWRAATYRRTVECNPWIPEYVRGKGLNENAKQRQFLLFADILEIFYGGAAGGGKLLYNGTMIPTPTGFRELRDLHSGDLILGRDGKAHVILAESDVVTAPAYRLTFDDGAELIAHDDHLWLTYDSKELSQLTRLDPEWRARRREKRPSRSSIGAGQRWQHTQAHREHLSRATTERNQKSAAPKVAPPTGTVRTTTEIVATLKTERGRLNHAIPVAEPLELPEKDLPLDPYVLGVWLGDGTSLNGDITTADAEITEAIEKAGFPVRCRSAQPNNKAARVAHHGLRLVLKGMGLLSNKHVPHEYLWASRAQRLALLQGLLDTDGGVERGSASFTNTRKELAESVAHLVRSLGHKATVREGVAKLNGRIIGPKWTVKFAAKMQVFRLKAKAEKLKLASRRTTRFRYIVSAVRVDPIEMKCLRVSAPDHLFLAGEHLIPTHNSYATLVAASQYVDVPGYSALLLRENFADLNQPESWIPLSRKWWQGKGVAWNERDRRWTFPSGATITFGYLDSDKAVYQYDSASFHFIAIDELTQHSLWRYQFMFGRMRRPATGPLSKLPLRMRSTSNPGNSGHVWVRSRFVDEKTREPGAMFVPARLSDNAGNLDVKEYKENSLAKLDPLTRAQREKGDWDAVAGGRFQAAWLTKTWELDKTWRDWAVLSDGERFNWRTAPTFQTCDPSASASDAADYFVLSTWKVTPEAKLVWWMCEREKLEIPAQVSWCQSSYRQYRPQFVAVEEVLNQRALAQLLRASTNPMMVVKGVSPLGKDKLARAAGAISLAASGRLYLPAAHPLFPLDDVKGELVRFTGLTDKESSDVVDTFSYACSVLPMVRCGGGAGGGSAPFLHQSKQNQWSGLR